MSIINDVVSKIDSMERELVEYVKNILSFPTTSGNELENQRYIADVLQNELKFDEIDMWEPDIDKMRNHEAFITRRENFKGSPNVVGTLKGKGTGKSLILNSHIDVVPAGNHNEWIYPPFQGTVDNGNIYGRGVSDMKGNIASFFIIIKALQELDIKLKGDLIIQSVIEEESGGAGSLACALRGYSADAAIIPEPTYFKICPAQQGSTWFRINISGKAAHGGERYKGISAIDKTIPILHSINELEKYRNNNFKNKLYKGIPTP
ncbi:MAG: ArgE/DapE family deacylase, partial [Deferribacterota bacterium]|nr:ArgE/DapE family deacylase [Deferribacterota bacterium]